MLTKSGSLRITWISACMNVLLGLIKCVVGWAVNSKALFADGLHSLVDLSTDMVVIVGLKLAAKPEDASHPYGHQRFASLATLLIAFFLLSFCIGLIHTSVRGLLVPMPVSVGWAALSVAGISLIVKEWLFSRTRKIARREKSRLTMANAWHHRIDSISSLVVLIALIAVSVGGPAWYFLDNVVGMVLGGWLGAQSIKMLVDACKDLVDAAPETEIINDLREHVLQVPGAVAYHQFRVRRLGDMLTLDLHLQVEPDLTVGQGHEIAGQVKDLILAKHPEVIEVLVHLEPADEHHIKDHGVHDNRNDTG